MPALGFGVAVPPGWEATLLSPEGLAALSSAAPAVQGFVERPRRGGQGGLLYAAGQDDRGRVSDVLVRAAPTTGVTDAAGLAGDARDLAGQAGRTDPDVEAVEGAALPTVRLRFRSAATTARRPRAPRRWCWPTTASSGRWSSPPTTPACTTTWPHA